MICDNSLATHVMDPLLKTMGLRGYLFCVFWADHKIWVDCTSGIELFVFLGVESSCLFNVFKKGNEFVFELGCGILGGALCMCLCPGVMLGLCWCSPLGP